MMDVLQGIGYGIVALAVLVVVGLVVLTKLGDASATCSGTDAYNITDRTCWNATASNGDPTNSAWSSSNYLSTQLGSNGLSGWVPAVIAVAIGALFLSYFMGKKTAR
jgi:hypothetical protein